MSENTKFEKSTSNLAQKKKLNIDLNPPKKTRSSYEKQLSLEEFTPTSHKKLLQYICPLCNGILVEPLMDQKGHMFCEKCLSLYESNFSSKNKKLICPVSNHILKTGNLKPNEKVNNYLKEIICYCPNKKDGCSWEGKYHLRKKHLEKECEFINLEKCPNEGCNLKIKTEKMKSHLEEECSYRKILCSKCKKNIVFNMKKIHEVKECDKFMKVNKKNLCLKCGLEVTEENMEKHFKEECPEIEIDCDFLFFGCKDKFLRKNKYKHYFELNNVVSHSKMTLNWLNNFKTQFDNRYSNIQNHLEENRIKMNLYKKYLIND